MRGPGGLTGSWSASDAAISRHSRLDAHWRNWIHMAIPALGDRTPLEAVQEAEGREMVRALLDDMERREQHLGMGSKQQVSIDRAREQLGLQS